jgi:hypothetical protein
MVMSLFSRKQKDKDESAAAESVYFSQERIDRDGNAWRHRGFWFRQVHLGKLKVIAHFQKKKTQVLIDQAVQEFIDRHWDETGAVENMVKQTGKVKIPTS